MLIKPQRLGLHVLTCITIYHLRDLWLCQCAKLFVTLSNYIKSFVDLCSELYCQDIS